jgi:hypothetical protein
MRVKYLTLNSAGRREVLSPVEQNKIGAYTFK